MVSSFKETSFRSPSMVYISAIIAHITHYKKNHAGPSVWELLAYFMWEKEWAVLGLILYLLFSKISESFLNDAYLIKTMRGKVKLDMRNEI